MSRELAMAAMRGVDVRIVTPGIPDKKLTYSLTRSYYADLVRYGVRIYEYTPGFIHAKQWVSDGEVSVVGTINMDFRSLTFTLKMLHMYMAGKLLPTYLMISTTFSEEVRK